MRKRVTILGSTGSVGRSALDVVRRHPDRFEVTGLAAGADHATLAEQIREFRPARAALRDEASAEKLGSLLDDTIIEAGHEAVKRIASEPVDVVLCAIVGAAGLESVLAAIEAGNCVALANKEPIVMAGALIMERAREKNVDVLPVDSEHSAIFQCLEGRNMDEVHRVHLTASGGPFYGRSQDELADVLPEQATNHPTWDMGEKISVDSATLMNKGLEVIEAMRLFSLPLDKIRVVIHPQSIVHSIVEFADGGMLAHLGPTDMRIPIQFALTWPERVECPVPRLKLEEMRDLTFEAPDFSQFPCLDYALQAAARGGTAPAVLNAANEEAVDAFRKAKIGFTQIPEIVRNVMSNTHISNEFHLDAILAADADARAGATALIESAGVGLA